MRVKPVLLALLLFCPAQRGQGEDALTASRFSFHFEPNSNRLLAGEQSQFAALSRAVRALPDGSLEIKLPEPLDPPHRRLLAARLSELDRQLAMHGLAADHRNDSQDSPAENELAVFLRRSPAVSAPPSVSETPKIAATAPVEAPPPVWIAESGRTLRSVLGAWAAQAGWSLVWQSSFDYPLEASGRFSGDFPSAVAALLGGFAEAKPPPTARIFSSNQVVIIR
jgi:hypothetical protein